MLAHIGTRVWMRLRRWYRRNAHMLGLAEDRRSVRRRRPPGANSLAYRAG